jgi:hypothetical protein
LLCTAAPKNINRWHNAPGADLPCWTPGVHKASILTYQHDAYFHQLMNNALETNVLKKGLTHLKEKKEKKEDLLGHIQQTS